MSGAACSSDSRSCTAVAVHLGRDPGQRALLQASGSAQRRAAVLRARRGAVRGRAAVCHPAVRGLDGCARQRLLWRRSSLQAAPRHVLSPQHFQRPSAVSCASFTELLPTSRSCHQHGAATSGSSQARHIKPRRCHYIDPAETADDLLNTAQLRERRKTQSSSRERSFLNRAGDGRVRSKDKSIVQSLRAASASPSPRPRPRPAPG